MEIAMEKKYVLDGYAFPTATEYERAKKEKETITYLTANTDMSNMKEVYKVYKLAVEKKSFQTVFGLEYMQGLRGRLVGSGIVSEDVIEPVPVSRGFTLVQGAGEKGKDSEKEKMSSAAAEREVKKYQEAYQKAKAGSMIKNFLIVVLVLVVGAMLYITSKNQYSILTYFTNYEEKIREEVIDEYEEWENQLREREKELEERQK